MLILTPGCYSVVILSAKHVGWDEAANPMALSVTEVYDYDGDWFTMMLTGSVAVLSFQPSRDEAPNLMASSVTKVYD